MRILVLTPHFEPDVAPTGLVVTRLVHELAALGHRIDVVTAYPWYREHRVEPGYAGRLYRYEDAPWGRIVRVHPFPSEDKTRLLSRALGFAAFTAVAGALAGRGDPVDGVLAVSPPLTLGAAGAYAAVRRRAPFVFNIQDVYPDVAIDLGYLRDRRLVAAARRLERFCYERADAITVLSQDLEANVVAKGQDPAKVRVIPNFVDTTTIVPSDRENPYRAEFGLSGRFVVMYAGNVGLSQPLEILIDAAAALEHEDDIRFVVNGQGARVEELRARAGSLANVVFAPMQPADRLPEVLAAADVHVVPLRRGLARASVPSKTYSILAAGRPLLASVDPESEVARVVRDSGAGLAVPPEDAEALSKAIRSLYEDRSGTAEMGARGRTFIETWHSPAAVAGAYADLFGELAEG